MAVPLSFRSDGSKEMTFSVNFYLSYPQQQRVVYTEKVQRIFKHINLNKDRTRQIDQPVVEHLIQTAVRDLE